jgi:Trypsin
VRVVALDHLARRARALSLTAAAIACLGLAPAASAVVGGGPASPAAWPWAAALLHSSQPDAASARFCTGTLLRGEWVLTAAHCVFDDSGRALPPDEIDVAVGATDLAALAPQNRIPAARIVVYPGYSVLRYGRDIALVQLSRAPGVAPAALVSGPSGERRGWVAGFGLNEQGTPALLTGEVSVSTPLQCARYTRSLPAALFPRSPWGTVCATLPDSLEASACFGDSGGPLADFRRDPPRVLGVVSYGPGYCGQGVTSVYSDVGAYRPWISRVTAGQDPAIGLPEVSSVYVKDGGRRIAFRANWCQAGGAGTPVRVQFIADRLSPAPRRSVIVQQVRGRAPGDCARASAIFADRYPNGRYEVRVKVIDRGTGMASYGLPSALRVTGS